MTLLLIVCFLPGCAAATGSLAARAEARQGSPPIASVECRIEWRR
jgi:hypothetical protein